MGKTMCFTGHRPDKLGGYDQGNPTATQTKKILKALIESAINRGYDTFITGGALGVDQWAAEIVLDCKCAQPSRRIDLVMAIPFKGYESRWIQSSKEHFYQLLNLANKVVYVCPEGYSAAKMQKRNEWMIDRSDLVVAVWDGTPGGTFNAFQYSLRNRKPIIRVNPANNFSISNVGVYDEAEADGRG